MDALRPLRDRGNDLIVFHLLDPAELDFPFDERELSRTWRPVSTFPSSRGAARAVPRRSCRSTSRRCPTRLRRSAIDYALFEHRRSRWTTRCSRTFGAASD